MIIQYLLYLFFKKIFILTINNILRAKLQENFGLFSSGGQINSLKCRKNLAN